MAKLRFQPRKSFERGLHYLGKLDPTIIEEVQAAIDILLEGNKLPVDYNDHQLKRRLSAYREFHIRDTPKGKKPTQTNDVVVIYKINQSELVLIAVDVGSHLTLFKDNHKNKYTK